jgi:hypothetical protein
MVVVSSTWKRDVRGLKKLYLSGKTTPVHCPRWSSGIVLAIGTTRFTGSNPAEDNGFLRVINIHNTTSSEGK